MWPSARCTVLEMYGSPGKTFLLLYKAFHEFYCSTPTAESPLIVRGGFLFHSMVNFNIDLQVHMCGRRQGVPC